MKKYIVFVVTLAATLGSLSASDLHPTNVTLTYQFWNNHDSHSAGLVPQRFRTDWYSRSTPTLQADQEYCVTFRISTYSAKTTFSLAHLKNTVINHFELNEFITLRIFNDQDEEITTSELSISDLHNAHLYFTYDPIDNTPEKIQYRRKDYYDEHGKL